MKKFFILFTSFFTLLAFDAMAQSDSLFTVNPGETISQVIPKTAQWFSKNFIKGQAWFNDGRTGTVTLNYNWFYDEMMFINEKGDTLAFANPQDFKQFALGEDTFYFADNKYFQKVGAFGNLQLTEKPILGIADIKKIGAMGIETSTVATDELGQLPQINTGETKNLVLRDKTIIRKATQYYISNKYNTPKPATKKNIQKTATENEWTQLQKYLNANTVNFSKKEDLVGLLSTLQ
ncbi:MAG: hypothetical protein ACRDE5_12495 [Ginsengibacter sp.]